VPRLDMRVVAVNQGAVDVEEVGPFVHGTPNDRSGQMGSTLARARGRLGLLSALSDTHQEKPDNTPVKQVAAPMRCAPPTNAARE
jgi:hypothetical protein